MIKLGVNIDHIATLRQARRENIPSVVDAALACEKAGSEAITLHLREDRRHIQDYDVYSLREILKTKLNLEMATNEKIVNIALDVKPDSVCIVPEKREELTTEGGLDAVSNKVELSGMVSRLKKAGIIVSMFVDARKDQILACSEIGADSVEIHTGKYSLLFKEAGVDSKECKTEIDRIKKAAREAVKKKMILNAGHGLDYANVEHICKIEGMNEFNIGFSIISEAVFIGLKAAVLKMKNLISK